MICAPSFVEHSQNCEPYRRERSEMMFFVDTFEFAYNQVQQVVHNKLSNRNAFILKPKSGLLTDFVHLILFGFAHVLDTAT